MTARILETEIGRQFYRSICETPGDDVPRLIFADWLEENGHAEQAEFIRLGIKLDALPWPDMEDGEAWDRVSDAREPLTRRAESLLAAHRREWTWPVAELDGGGLLIGSFSRGFLYSLTMPGRLFVQNARAIFSVHPITRVELPNRGWQPRHRAGEDYVVEFFDADLTKRGRRAERLPGPIFAFLDRVGLPCAQRGARAELCIPREYDSSWWRYGEEIISRAAVAYGRHQAGLPPLAWPPTLS
jgi:uncharacterized protein (TIGR02996 family)